MIYVSYDICILCYYIISFFPYCHKPFYNRCQFFQFELFLNDTKIKNQQLKIEYCQKTFKSQFFFVLFFSLNDFVCETQ